MCFHAMFIANQCLAQIAQIKSHNQGNWGTKNSDKKNTNMDLTWHILTCRLAAKWPRPTPTSSLSVFFSTSINFAASTFPWWTMVNHWKNTTSKVAAKQKRNRYQTNKQKTYKQLIKIHTETPWKNFLFFSESWREQRSMKWLNPSQKGIGTPIKKYQQVLSILRSINREDRFVEKKS